jgi:uncharacterized membrane protein
MPSLLKQKFDFQNNYLLLLGAVTGFNLLLLAIRSAFVSMPDFHFLLWNLFLAFLPMLFAWLAFLFVHNINTIFTLLLMLLWLLFYPNAPYMISDMIHTDPGSRYVLYDAMILFSFAILALYYGFYSLKIIHRLLLLKVARKTALLLIILSIIFSSAGIYLGRVLRLNSWDFFTRPLYVGKLIFTHLLPVNKNPTTYVIIFLFSAIQFILLLLARDLDDINKENLISGAPVGPADEL